MSKKIRILALNDDNHETSFHTEWIDKVKYNHMELIRLLAEPHTEEYEVRCVYLLDIDENDVKNCHAFDVVQSGGHIKGASYFTAFEHLWEIGKENMFG